MSEQATALPKIYVFCNQKDCDGRGDWHSMIAISQDGEALAEHVCSHHAYARNDMGINENGWKRDIYAQRYPQGFEVVWLEGDEIDRVLATLPKPAMKESQ